LGACQNFLTPALDNQYAKSRFYTDPAWAQGLLINAYTSLLTTYEVSDVATDDAVTNDLTGTTYWPWLRLATGEWSALFDPSSVWSASYGALLNMNYFLSIVNQVQWSWQDTIRNRMFRQRYIGEAFAFKGWYYLRLLERYGGIASDGVLRGVPIASGVITSADNYALIRPPYQATVDSINSFLESGRKLLPYLYFDIPNATAATDLAWNRVNGASWNQNLMNGRIALACRARLALMAGSPAFNGGVNYDLVKCDTAAHIVGRMVNNNPGGFAAFPQDANFWNADADITNAEIIWRQDYVANSTRETDNYPPSVFGNGRINPTQNLVDAFPMANGYPINNALSLYNNKKPYVGRDSRLKLNVLVDSTSLRSTIIRTESDYTATNDGLNRLTLYSTRTGYYLWKFLRTDTNLNPASPSTTRHFYTRIRWTEMYLIYAEASNEKYGPDGDYGAGFTARQVIAAIRKRAGITQPDAYLATITTTAAMRDLIRNERRLEMCFESVRFWDIRRWYLPASTINANAMGMNATGTPAVYTNPQIVVEPRIFLLPQMYYGPIPYLDTKKYPGMLQNKGW